MSELRRSSVSSGSCPEPILGFARAVRVGFVDPDWLVEIEADAIVAD